MSTYVQQQAVNIAIRQECAASVDVEFLPLRQAGKEFVNGFSEYALALKTEATEKQLYLHIFPTFETKYTHSTLLDAYVTRIRREIDDFWNTSDEKTTRTTDIS